MYASKSTSLVPNEEKVSDLHKKYLLFYVVSFFVSVHIQTLFN